MVCQQMQRRGRKGKERKAHMHMRACVHACVRACVRPLFLFALPWMWYMSTLVVRGPPIPSRGGGPAKGANDAAVVEEGGGVGRDGSGDGV